VFRPQATVAERAILRWLAPPAVLLVLGALGWQSCSTWKLERGARRDAQTACAASGLSEPECALQVKQRGDACWERNYHCSRKGIPATFNANGYRACVLENEGAPPSP
jgi:hypothetical protein